MCGIAGMFRVGREPRLAEWARRSNEILRHRGPDDAGASTFEDPRGGAGFLAHTRLAIQDLSPRGRQPMLDARGALEIVYNGEVYNFVELRGELEREGREFRSGSDTEVLLELFAARGPSCLDSLDGMFAFLLRDTRSNTLHVVRDRFGIKPLYHVRIDETLCFASEIKAFLAHPGFRARANEMRVADFLVRGLLDHTDETMFAGVGVVPAGCRAEIDLARPAEPLRFLRWYTPHAERVASTVDAATELRFRLQGAVERRLRADVPVGSCLSGGLDSSTIVSLLGEARRHGRAAEIITFTARSENAALDEGRFASLVARRAGAEAMDVHTSAAELWTGFDDLVYAQDEPPPSASIWLQNRVFSAARERGVRVLLDGQGADEQLAGYHTFFKVWLLECLRDGELGEFRSTWRAMRHVHGYSAMSVLRKLLAAALPSEPAAWLSRRGAVVRRVASCFRLPGPLEDPLARGEGRRRGVREFSLEQIARDNLPMLLHFEDRNSMAHSIEARVPFLSHPVVELSLGLAASRKIGRGLTKSVLREATRGLVPDEIRERRDKIAFAADEARWLGADSRAEIDRRLVEAMDTLAPILRLRGGEELRRAFDSPHGYDPLLFRVLALASWARRFEVRW